MIEQTIKEFVLSNRSLAENNPLNLVNRGNKAIDNLSKTLTEQSFINYINRILDAIE